MFGTTNGFLSSPHEQINNPPANTVRHRKNLSMVFSFLVNGPAWSVTEF